MKYTTMFILLFVLALSGVGCQSTPAPAMPANPTPSPTTAVETPPPAVPTATPEPEKLPSVETNWSDHAMYQPGLIAGEQPVLDDLSGATVYHLDLRIADDLLQVTGHQEVHYTNREGNALAEIYFRLFPNVAGGNVTVSNLEVEGQPVTPVYEFEDTALKVPLPQPLPSGESVIIGMDFEIDIPVEMAGNYGLFGYFDNVLVLDQFYPTIPVYDDEGWNVETPPPNADLSYNDVSLYRVQVTAPANLTLVAVGIETERELNDKTQTVTFAAGPARDFYLAAGEDFVVVSDTVGETTINSYALPERVGRAETALQIAADSLRSFNQRFGPYPYTEFDVVSTPMQALGIEYPGIVGIALMLYDPTETIADLPSGVLLESTVAHEVAHQWFYNTVGNDQVDEPWLDEALAQYATWLYYVDIYGETNAAGYAQSWEDWWQRVDLADIPIGLPAGDYEGREYGAIVYGRGPLFVAALAEAMGGQEEFDEFLRIYTNTYHWQIASTETFKTLAEEHCRCDLTDLFEEWVYEK